MVGLRHSLVVISHMRFRINMRPLVNLTRRPIHNFGWTGAILAVLLISRGLFVFAAERVVVDDLGFKVKVKTNVQRVVSLVPTNSEMVCLLDCERLKGGTRYDAFPEELKNRIDQKQVEIIGGGFDANLEKIIRLQPDLVLTNGPSQQRLAVPLKNMGYSVLSLWPRDMSGLRKDFLLLGQLLGREHKAKQVLGEIQKKFSQIETRTKNHRKKRVYLQMWTDPLITVGQSSFPHWLVSAAGGINVFGDMTFDSGQISLESIIQRNPEVLIFLADQEPSAKKIRTQAGWNAIDGVRHEHYCFIEEPDIRRSVQFVNGLTKIHNCIFNENKAAPWASTEAR